jgi:hypothetical protein
VKRVVATPELQQTIDFLTMAGQHGAMLTVADLMVLVGSRLIKKPTEDTIASFVRYQVPDRGYVIRRVKRPSRYCIESVPPTLRLKDQNTHKKRYPSWNDEGQNWPRLSEQIFRVDKWSVYRG